MKNKIMEKQKICIIGASLTGLATAISLSKLNCKIDLVAGQDKRNFKTIRTTAVSQDNYDFLNQLNISKSLKKHLWPSSIIKLYSESQNKQFNEIFELNKKNKKNKILYMLENSKIINLMLSKIRKSKNISFIKNKNISEIKNLGLLKGIKFNNKNFKYNLIIICVGNNADLVKKIFRDQKIESRYNETAITTILKHKTLQNNVARQIFLDNEILAMLPLSNSKTSIVWSKRNIGIKKNNAFFKKRIKFYTKSYLKNISFISDLEFRDLYFLIRKKYYTDRVLLFGDALHVIHPFVGQGFNMTLRDLASLEKILRIKISLGLDIGSSDILSEFTDEKKSSNFAFSISTNILKDSFSVNNTYFKKFRNKTFKLLNKNSYAKNILFNIADKGFKF